MNRTKIDWPNLAYSFNPIVGCANGCPYCYAKRINDRFNMIPNFTKPVFFPNRIDEPMKFKKPATIFVGSMCDIFSEGVSKTWIHHIIETVKNCTQHTFMFLTKKPEMYKEFLWPSGCFLGTTVEHINDYSHRKRIRDIRDIQGNTFISIEPIRSSFDDVDLRFISLIIVGADSTPGAKIPPLEWIKSINHQNIWYKKNLRDYYPELKNKGNGL